MPAQVCIGPEFNPQCSHKQISVKEMFYKGFCGTEKAQTIDGIRQMSTRSSEQAQLCETLSE